MSDDDDKKVFIGYFHHSVPTSTLKEIFSKFGQIKSLWKSPSVPRTFAFVIYRSAEAAQNSVKQLNGIFIDKDCVKVNLAKDKDQEFLANVSAESCSEDECCLNKENGHKKHQKDCIGIINQQSNESEFISLKRSKSTSNINSESKNGQQLNSDGNKNLIFTKSNNNLLLINPTDDQKKTKHKKTKFRYFNQAINSELESYSPKPAKKSKNDLNILNKLNKNDEQNQLFMNNKKTANQKILDQFRKQFANQKYSTAFNNNNKLDNLFNERYNNQNNQISQINSSNQNNISDLNQNYYYNPFNLTKTPTDLDKTPSPRDKQKQHNRSNKRNESTLTIDLTSPAASFCRINHKTGEIDIEDTLENNKVLDNISLDTSIEKFEIITIDD